VFTAITVLDRTLLIRADKTSMHLVPDWCQSSSAFTESSHVGWILCRFNYL